MHWSQCVMSAQVTALLDTGTTLGDWRIDGLIGIGGMGTVYAATHTAIGKRAAIKVVRSELCADPVTAERFVQEASVVNRVGHPAIIDIFHIGKLDDGRVYLVMELLEGRTLGQRMAEGRLPPVEAIDILLKICDGLAAAHACDVVHRDLKPDNIILVDGGTGLEVKLVDWGIAKVMNPLPTSGTLTTTGTLVGTPQYMSPEQARGNPVDGLSDVYSLGAIAYELFLEGPPFFADNIADLVAMQLREPPPPPSELWPDIPVALEGLLLAMLAKRPEGRPGLDEIVQTLRGLRDELASRRYFPRRSPPKVVPVVSAARERAQPRRMPMVGPAVVAIATVLMLAASGVTVTAGVATWAPAPSAEIAPATAVPDVIPPPVEHAKPVKRTAERRRPVRHIDPDGTIDPFE